MNDSQHNTPRRPKSSAEYFAEDLHEKQLHEGFSDVALVMRQLQSLQESGLSVREARMGYSEYLESNDWQEKRTAVRKRAKARCELCGISEAKYTEGNGGVFVPFSTHHTTYERCGREDLEDLLYVCPDCHSKEHGL